MIRKEARIDVEKLELRSPLPDGVRRIRLAYLTNAYPKVSHTFIRREILELERRGHEILRLAIHGSGDDVADDTDRREAARTIHFMALPRWKIASAAILLTLVRPRRFVLALWAAMKMSRASERGLLRHLAYLVEALTFCRILDRHHVEHVHVHFGTNAAAVAQLIRLLGGPSYSMTVHGPVEFDAPIGFSLREKVADAEFVVAISHFCFAQLCRWVPASQWSKIHIVHCSVDDSFFQMQAPVRPESRMLLSIGRLDAQKGQVLLLEAVKQVLDEGFELDVVLVGDGELRSLIEKKIVEYRIGGSVKVTGWLDESNIRQLLLDSRALVQPSFAEGLPVVIMEAFAMGRPVISTHVAGIPELVRQGVSGWLVAAGDTDELVVAIRDAMTKLPDQLTAMGVAGRNAAMRSHHVKTEVATLEKLFLCTSISKDRA